MKFITLVILNLALFGGRTHIDVSGRESKVIQNSAQWDSKVLGTGESVAYLTALEKEVLLELNKVRSDPPRYAAMYISPIQNELRGKLNTQNNVETNEGVTAVLECVAQLNKTRAMGLLNPDQDLAKAALRHTSKQSKTRQTGHNSPNGETFEDRLQKLKFIAAAECISYGEDMARGIVTSLLIDDGVASRGHRKIILDPKFLVVGISAGGHMEYGHMCTIDFGAARATKGRRASLK